jgi:hypothetical protein
VHISLYLIKSVEYHEGTMNLETGRNPGEMEAKKKVKIVDNRPKELPEMNIEELDAPETTESASFKLADGGGEAVKASTVEVATRKLEQRTQKARENGSIIVQKKLELGMEPQDLREMITGELEEVEDTIEATEEQGALLDDAVTKRENLLAQLKAVDAWEEKQKAA